MSLLLVKRDAVALAIQHMISCDHPGHEDSPDRIEVYEKQDPEITDQPIIYERRD